MGTYAIGCLLIAFSLSNTWRILHTTNIYRHNCYLKQEEVTPCDSLVMIVKTLFYEFNRDQTHTCREGTNIGLILDAHVDNRNIKR